MNIFVAGIHGVGKSYLASRVPADFGLMHTSASKLIKEERALTNWSHDKRVSDADGNQIALAAAVKRHNDAGTRLLLDGHFVLLDTQGEFLHLDSQVFKSLNLDGVILIEAGPQTIASRLQDRDSRLANIDHLEKFIHIERSHAQDVCEKLEIPLCILHMPSSDSFIQTVENKIAN